MPSSSRRGANHGNIRGPLPSCAPTKITICQNWLWGICPLRADQCPLAHSAQEVQGASSGKNISRRRRVSIGNECSHIGISQAISMRQQEEPNEPESQPNTLGVGIAEISKSRMFSAVASALQTMNMEGGGSSRFTSFLCADLQVSEADLKAHHDLVLECVQNCGALNACKQATKTAGPSRSSPEDCETHWSQADASDTSGVVARTIPKTYMKVAVANALQVMAVQGGSVSDFLSMLCADLQVTKADMKAHRELVAECVQNYCALNACKQAISTAGPSRGSSEDCETHGSQADASDTFGDVPRTISKTLMTGAVANALHAMTLEGGSVSDFLSMLCDSLQVTKADLRANRELIDECLQSCRGKRTCFGAASDMTHQLMQKSMQGIGLRRLASGESKQHGHVQHQVSENQVERFGSHRVQRLDADAERSHETGVETIASLMAAAGGREAEVYPVAQHVSAATNFRAHDRACTAPRGVQGFAATASTYAQNTELVFEGNQTLPVRRGSTRAFGVSAPSLLGEFAQIKCEQ